MDFSLSEDQLAFRELARDFARQEMVPLAADYDESGEFPWPVVRRAHQAGLLHLQVPEEYGGAGLSCLEAALIAEELGAGCAGMATSLMGNSLALRPILAFGSEEQKRRLLPDFCAGPNLATFCLTEPEAGSDIAGVKTAARREGASYVLDGVKTFITNGGVACLHVVIVSTDRRRGARGLSAFVVPADAPGVSTGKKERKMGQRASDTREVVFEAVRVPLGNRLGREGQGFRVALDTLNRARGGVGAVAVGLARAALETATEYAQQRVQFGKPIVGHQAVQILLADMAIAVETARLLVWRAAHATDEGGKEAERLSAMAKCYASDVAMRVSTDAVQVLGGYGYMKEYPVEKYMRDAKLLQIYEGTNQIQRLMIARRLG
ncbi:MAG: acyl-CoA dehydrogenase family protein [Chloroflexia bacterium]|nr:acyl-CoA dehydrogenase family protein [Chloroflexia bacterium]